ncbi:MAG: hypothetical protein AAF289_03235 [Cyanobacteria bacterium P01_A01_bin.135]
MADQANRTRRTVNRLGQLTRITKARDQLGQGDRKDLYEFRVGRSSRVTVTTRAPGPIAVVLRGRQAAIGRAQGRRRTLRAVLEAGRYFLQVSLKGRRPQSTPYRLTVRSQFLPPQAPPQPVTPVPPPQPISPSPAPVEPTPAQPAPLPPVLRRYDFTYYYRPNSPSSERYYGYVIAPAQRYRLGWQDVNPQVSESGMNGRYRITRISAHPSRQRQGQVFVRSYIDVNAGSAQRYQPYYQSRGLPSGRSGLGSELDYIDLSRPGQSTAPRRRFGRDYYAADPALTQISNLAFSGDEGETGQFRLRLTRQPHSLVSLRFARDGAITVDADGDISNGTQDTLSFTPDNWRQPQTVQFVAEPDGTDRDRSASVSALLSGGLETSETYSLGTIRSTTVPDASRYNIDLDFRADALGFWTPERRQVMQQAAQDWASRIADDLPDMRLDQVISLKQPVPSDLGQSITLESNRYIDDLVVFVGAYNALDGAGAWGNVQLGAFSSAEPLPRASMVTINQRYAINYTDAQLYWLMAHELGHALGLLRQSAAGRSLIFAPSPETAVFQGEYATVANGGQPVPLRSQDAHDHDHGNYDYGHVAASVHSVMGYTQRASQPTAVDFGMLADIGYRIDGVNA